MILASCQDSHVPDKKQSDPPPKALQDKSSLDEIVSKRGNDDLVERLYNELVDKTPELKGIENRITIVSENKKDSTELFDKYDEKNQTYYRSADKGIGRLGDSILKLKMRTLITNSLTKYNSSLFRHIAILKSIEKKKTTLEDFHLREKLFHFDHERIPERVVHARGYGAHGFFENYESLSDITYADLFQRPGERTPAFVRFSTVAGNKGNAGGIAATAVGFNT